MIPVPFWRLLVLLSCAPTTEDTGEFTRCGKEEPYIPLGPVVASVEECPIFPESCPYRCDPTGLCAGEPDALSCEECADLDHYNHWGLVYCRNFRLDGGAFSHTCE